MTTVCLLFSCIFMLLGFSVSGHVVHHRQHSVDDNTRTSATRSSKMVLLILPVIYQNIEEKTESQLLSIILQKVKEEAVPGVWDIDQFNDAVKYIDLNNEETGYSTPESSSVKILKTSHSPAAKDITSTKKVLTLPTASFLQTSPGVNQPVADNSPCPTKYAKSTLFKDSVTDSIDEVGGLAKHLVLPGGNSDYQEYDNYGGSAMAKNLKEFRRAMSMD